MANKQTLPNMTQTQKSYVNTQGLSTIPSINYKSPLRDVAGVVEKAAEFTDTYTKLKYEDYEFQAQNMQRQQFHEMADTRDPCELQAVKNKYDRAFEEAFNDEYLGTEYKKSRYYKNFVRNKEVNYEKAYLDKMHEFTEIQAVKNLNEAANTAALMETADDVDSYMTAGVNMVNCLKHITAERRYELISKYLNNTAGKLVTANPDMAQKYLSAVGDKYDKYGFDRIGLLNKTNSYLSAKKSEERAAYNFQKSLEKEQASAKASYYIAQYRMGNMQKSEVLQQAGAISPEVYNAVYEKVKDSSTDGTTNLAEYLSRIRDSANPEKEMESIFRQDLSLGAKERETISAYTKVFAATDKKPTDEDLIYFSGLEQGNIIATDDELKEKFTGELLKQALKARDNGIKTLKATLKEDKKEQRETDKENSKAVLLQKRTELTAIDDMEGLQKFIKEPQLMRGMNNTDANSLWGEINTKIKDIAKENKVKEKELLDYMQDNFYREIMENPQQVTNEDLSFYVFSKMLTAEKADKISNKRDELEKKDLENKIADHNSGIWQDVYRQWESGESVDGYTTINKLINVKNHKEVLDALQKGNKNVLAENYLKKMNGLTVDIYSKNMDMEEVKRRALLIAKETQQDYDKVLEKATKTWENKENDREGAITSAMKTIETLWGSPAFGTETFLEMDAKAKLKDYVQAYLAQRISENKDIGAFTSKENLISLVEQYKPNKREVMAGMEGFRLQKQALEEKRKLLAQYNKEEKRWVALENASPADIFDYRARTEAALNNQAIGTKEYAEFMGVVDDVMIGVIDKYAKKPNTVLGYTIKYFSERYFRGEAINYATMSDFISQSLDLLKGYGVNYDDSINDSFLYTYLGIGESKDKQNRTINEVLDRVMLFNQKPVEADAVLSGNNVIVL